MLPANMHWTRRTRTIISNYFLSCFLCYSISWLQTYPMTMNKNLYTLKKHHNNLPMKDCSTRHSILSSNSTNSLTSEEELSNFSWRMIHFSQNISNSLVNKNWLWWDASSQLKILMTHWDKSEKSEEYDKSILLRNDQ